MAELFTHLIDAAKGKVTLDSPRSPKWPSVRDAWLKLQSSCAVCGSRQKLQVHHKRPFHLYPELELDPSNFITLCEARGFINCHLTVGHLGNFKSYNPSVNDMAAALYAALNNRPEPRYIP